MAKALKTILIAIVVVVAFYYFGPMLVGNAAFEGASFLGLEGLAAAAAQGAFIGAMSVAAQSFIKKPSMDMMTVETRLNLSVDDQALGKWCFGETPLASDVIYAEHHGGGDGPDGSEFVTYIIAGAGHLIDSFGDLYINDELITFSGDAATGAWADGLWRQTKIGTSPQVEIQAIDGSDNFTWPVEADGEGMTHYRLRFRVGHIKLKGGIPSRVTQIAKCAPVYDPRLDTTVGGSGAHRADDQTTWEYSNGGVDIGANWALIAAYYLLGWKQNGTLQFGVGIDPDDIDYDQLIAAANVCDATIDSKPRFRIGGIMEMTNDHDSIQTQLEAAIGGKISQVGGKYFIWAPNDDLTPYGSAIVDGDLVKASGIEFRPSGPLEDLWNTGRGRYVSVADQYIPLPYPEVVESAAVTEDGRSRLLDHDLAVVQDVSVAERVVRMLIRRSRFSATWRFAMGPKGLLYQPFSIATINLQETNNADTVVRIINMDYSVRGVVLMECIEEDSSIYNTADALGTPITTLDPSAMDPTTQIDVTTLAVANITVAGTSGTSSDGFKVTWDDPGGFVVSTQVQFRVNGDSDWNEVAQARIGSSQALIVPVESGTQYNIRARHISIFGVFGDWATPVNKTAGLNATAYDSVNIGGVSAATIIAAQGNFDGRNDRSNTAIVTPSIIADETAIDHIIATSGDASISFEFTWAGSEPDIDGFIIYTRESGSPASYNFGAAPAEETQWLLGRDRRAFALYGVPADSYFTFGVQGYRIIDDDVGDNSGIKLTAIVQPSHTNEDPYQPSSTVAFAGNLTGTVAGTSASTISAGAILGNSSSQATGVANNATKNTQDLRSDTFDLSANYTGISYINLWQIDRDGSCPVTLSAGTTFNFDSSGAYLITMSLTVSITPAADDDPYSVTITPYVDTGGGFSPLAKKVRIEGFMGTAPSVGTVLPSADMAFVYEATAGDDIKFFVARSNVTSHALVASEASIDFIRLTQDIDV